MGEVVATMFTLALLLLMASLVQLARGRIRVYMRLLHAPRVRNFGLVGGPRNDRSPVYYDTRGAI